MNDVYWTTKDGEKLNVDDMSESHVRNSFKMILRNIKKQQVQLSMYNEYDFWGDHH